MDIVQFQHIDPETRKHLGGLYVNTKHISAIFRHIDIVAFTWIELSNGSFYLLPIHISSVLDDLNKPLSTE